MKKDRWKKAGLALMVLLFVAVTIGAVPVMMYMTKPEFQQELRRWVEDAGIWGMLALLLIQLLQVVVAIIPGEPIEVAAGAMYGTFGGLAICLFGTLVASSGIFAVVRKLGRTRLEKTRLYKKLEGHTLLNSPGKLQSLVFLFYLIPGTPKDMLVYVCALTHISMRDFLTLSTLARVPSVVTSTMAGASFMSGNMMLTVGIFLATGLLGLLGIIYQNRRFGENSNR